MERSEFLNLLIDILNLASEKLRQYSSVITDDEQLRDDLDEDLIQPLFIFLIEDILIG